jgi:glycine cleavage system H lipoate-binding protein
MMPKMDGLQFIDGIRRSYPNILIVMITGYATMETALKTLRKGAFDYIAKPFTIEELRNVVRSAARAALMPKAEKGAGAAEKAESYRTFFNQTYASIRDDGTLSLGVEEAFVTLIGKPVSLELANVGETISQGFPFGSITNSRMKVFNLRAPFSGVVLGVNDEAIGNISLIENDPCGKGWLLHVKPGDFETEIENLGS